jgi:hypothetical protein
MNRARRYVLKMAVVLAGIAGLAGEAAAQSDILLQLRSGSPAGDRFRVDSAGGVIALGQIGYGIIPASGAGWRMMWYPFKTAFRAGYADAGGQFDDANIGFYSWAGGALSKAAGNYAFAMGNQNNAEAQCGIAIGSGNNVFGNATDGFATCGTALGLNNDVKDQAGVAIGQNNWSDGDAAIAIGYTSTADADYSVAMGYRASTNGHTGAWSISDASTTDSLEADANNRFHARFANGYKLFTNATTTIGVQVLASQNSWSTISDRNLKTGIRALDGEDILSRIRSVPVTTWRYADPDAGRYQHIGPMAQDFHKAFNLNDDDKSINMADLDGVTLAGVQALEARTQKMQRAMDEKDKTIADLQSRLARIEALLAAKK